VGAILSLIGSSILDGVIYLHYYIPPLG